MFPQESVVVLNTVLSAAVLARDLVAIASPLAVFTVCMFEAAYCRLQSPMN
jgi:hypothetical protein